MAQIIFYSFFAGITIFIGGLASKYFERCSETEVKEEIVHTSIAFGGGLLIAAISFVLVPEGMKTLSLIPIILLFVLGSFIFLYIDKYLEQKGGSIAQLLAMLMDFIPEVIALGAVFAHDSQLGILLAIFIGFQNLPESFNAYIELRDNGYASRTCLLILLCLSFSGVLFATLGNLFLKDNPHLTASLMLFCSGGILYLIFQDIAPMSKLNKRWFPAIGACLGFLIGIIGEKIIG